jgi:pimeloyl-ACP methyl ester carboxylesterase
VQRVPLTTKIVFVYHSFGGFIYAVYIHKYPSLQARVAGQIDLGGIPIRAYPLVIRYLKAALMIEIESMVENAEFYYSEYRKVRGKGLTEFKNKYVHIIWMKAVKSKIFEEVF